MSACQSHLPFSRLGNDEPFRHTTNNDQIHDAALLYEGAPAAKLLMLPSTQPASVCPVFLLNQPLYPRSSALFCSLPSSSLLSQPGDVCWFVHAVFLTLSPLLTHIRRVRTGGEAGVTDELKSTRLAHKLAP